MSGWVTLAEQERLDEQRTRDEEMRRVQLEGEERLRRETAELRGRTANPSTGWWGEMMRSPLQPGQIERRQEQNTLRRPLIEDIMSSIPALENSDRQIAEFELRNPGLQSTVAQFLWVDTIAGIGLYTRADAQRILNAVAVKRLTGAWPSLEERVPRRSEGEEDVRTLQTEIAIRSAINGRGEGFENFLSLYRDTTAGKQPTSPKPKAQIDTSHDEEPDRDATCPICSERRSATAWVPCGHTTCGQCAAEWAKEKGDELTCPSCRAKCTGLLKLFIGAGK